jgi:predicted esterase
VLVVSLLLAYHHQYHSLLLSSGFPTPKNDERTMKKDKKILLQDHSGRRIVTFDLKEKQMTKFNVFKLQP